MDKIRIEGGQTLKGRVTIGGAKNAVLPAMTASLLTDEPIVLTNVPDVWDVGTMRRLLTELGVRVEAPDSNSLKLHMPELRSYEAPYELVKTMRASVMVLGPLAARHGKARVSLPGGCSIGARPIDFHISALEKLGAKVKLEHGFVDATASGLQGTEVYFDDVTVTGTENILMAACLAQGVTVLQNCAEEPEVVDLALLLNKMGARIEGAGTRTIHVEGVERLHGAQHDVIPDRIEAGTYLAAGALTGEEVLVDNCNPEHLAAVIDKLQELGVTVEPSESSVRIHRAQPFRPAKLKTLPYPGFPTDMQAQLMVLLTQAQGTSVISETIFENRFMHVSELNRMGANVALDGHTAVVKGPTPLSAAKVMATDLRASACLVLAGLIAEGQTVIDRVYHLDRGYEHIEEKLAGLGARIERLKR